MIVASFHHFLGTWALLASWAVAVGTGALALATWWLGTKAQREAQAVTDQVTIEQEQLEAAQRPFVLPITDGWNENMRMPAVGTRPPTGGRPEPWLMLSNAGAGPAINIRGGLFWPGGIGGGWPVIPTSIGAGEHVPTKLETHAGYEVKWSEAVGYVRYTDLAETEWQTHFRYEQNTSGQYFSHGHEVGQDGQHRRAALRV